MSALQRLPDLALTDHNANRRRLSELVAGDPVVLQTYRGWWCSREVQRELGLCETTDDVRDPYVPAVFVLRPDLTVHRHYDGYWFWGRPTLDELVHDLREVSAAIRPDWRAPVA